MSQEILLGHCLDVLRTLPDASVQCCVTSPPYWGLRSYGTESQVWGGEDGCEHIWGERLTEHQRGKRGEQSTITGGAPHRQEDVEEVGEETMAHYSVMVWDVSGLRYRLREHRSGLSHTEAKAFARENVGQLAQGDRTVTGMIRRTNSLFVHEGGYDGPVVAEVSMSANARGSTSARG